MMFKNQLQELAQRSCFNLPSYACIREGPDHAPRFKASVNFNGEIFESPSFCPTLRQAEHAAAEAALNVLYVRGLSRSLTARVLDETGVYKNLLQETTHRAGLRLPVYTTIRSGPGHSPIFTCSVEFASMSFTGEPAKTKKQAEKNAAIAAWSALKTMPNLDSSTKKETGDQEDRDQAVVSRVLSSFRPKDNSKQFRRGDYNNQAKRRMVNGNNNDIIILPSSSASGKSLNHKNSSFVSLLPPPPPRTASKILPPVQVGGKHEVKPPPLLNQHDQVINKCIEKDGSSSSYIHGASTSCCGTAKINMLDNAARTEASELIRRIFGSPNPLQMAPQPEMARNMYTGGLNIAPAVKMRSIIPVCAAPPPPPNSMKIGPASASSVKFNNSDQLSSELKNLQLTK
ncbi:double-stranded RNA-binding protein 5-like [Hibiscus syriacus]|uniref:double-stranded RNA-binding protein 5-like n=1 Tax=Hibiscus syriacus TaxID=106335 RepID=UPI001921DF30|nr:double-stranded RNA-binding protein 5-like [Hibiscus syriacus]XP_038999651.1 double-stranded RNA-binding protein 5-like [Hibiscus syriacus]